MVLAARTGGTPAAWVRRLAFAGVTAAALCGATVGLAQTADLDWAAQVRAQLDDRAPVTLLRATADRAIELAGRHPPPDQEATLRLLASTALLKIAKLG